MQRRLHLSTTVDLLRSRALSGWMVPSLGMGCLFFLASMAGEAERAVWMDGELTLHLADGADQRLHEAGDKTAFCIE